MLESWLQICTYYDSRVVIYDRKMFIRLATGPTKIVWKGSGWRPSSLVWLDN